jgi:hypothetical protein
MIEAARSEGISAHTGFASVQTPISAGTDAA